MRKAFDWKRSRICKRNRRNRGNPASASLCSPQIPHDLNAGLRDGKTTVYCVMFASLGLYSCPHQPWLYVEFSTAVSYFPYGSSCFKPLSNWLTDWLHGAKSVLLNHSGSPHNCVESWSSLPCSQKHTHVPCPDLHESRPHSHIPSLLRFFYCCLTVHAFTLCCTSRRGCLPHCLDNRLTDGGEVVSQKYSWYPFVLGAESAPGP
jgi:hypothetical protein